MQTTSNAAVDKTAENTGAEKVREKLAEKRRALGRGLESLLPGPRVVAATPTLPQSARDGGWAGSPVPTLAVAPPDAVPGLWTSCRRWRSNRPCLAMFDREMRCSATSAAAGSRDFYGLVGTELSAVRIMR